MAFTFNKAAQTSVARVLNKIFAKTQLDAAVLPSDLPPKAIGFEYLSKPLNTAQEAIEWICEASCAKNAGLRLMLVLQNEKSLAVDSQSLSQLAMSKFPVDFLQATEDPGLNWKVLIPVQRGQEVVSTLKYTKNIGYVPVFESYHLAYEALDNHNKVAHYKVGILPQEQEWQKIATQEAADAYAKDVFKVLFLEAAPTDQLVFLNKSCIVLKAWQPNPGELACICYDWQNKRAVISALSRDSKVSTKFVGAFKASLEKKITQAWLNEQMHKLLF